MVAASKIPFPLRDGMVDGWKGWVTEQMPHLFPHPSSSRPGGTTAPSPSSSLRFVWAPPSPPYLPTPPEAGTTR